MVLKPERWRGVGGSRERDALVVLLDEYRKLVKAMAVCCMTAERFEHAQRVVADAEAALRSAGSGGRVVGEKLAEGG